MPILLRHTELIERKKKSAKMYTQEKVRQRGVDSWRNWPDFQLRTPLSIETADCGVPLKINFSTLLINVHKSTKVRLIQRLRTD